MNKIEAKQKWDAAGEAFVNADEDLRVHIAAVAYESGMSKEHQEILFDAAYAIAAAGFAYASATLDMARATVADEPEPIVNHPNTKGEAAMLADLGVKK